MLLLEGFVPGPYTSETPFKGAAIDRLSFLHHGKRTWFRIETEETEPGMPDTVCFSDTMPGYLVEYKITDKKYPDRFHFKKSQPLFYRQHPDLKILVLVWDRRFDRTVVVAASEVVEHKSLTMRIPEDLEWSVSVKDLF